MRTRWQWLIVVALLAGCAEPTERPSASAPSDVPSPSLSGTPSDSAPPSVGAPSGQVLEGFGYTDVLRVDVNGLAVRVAPDPSSPLVTGYRIDGSSVGDVRLNTGDYVSVELGPLRIGDMTWYRVWPAEGGQRGFSTISWDTDGTIPNPVEPGWVAASVGTDQYLSLHDADEFDPDAMGGLPVPLLLSGIGDYLSQPQDGFDLYRLLWAAAIDGQDAPCDFRVELLPVGGGSGEVAVAASFSEAFGEGQAQIERIGTFDPYQLAVSSGCEWSLNLEALGHD